MDFEDESAAETVEPEAAADVGESGLERQERFENRRDERPREDYRQGEQRPRDDRARSDAPRNERFAGERAPNDRGASERAPGGPSQNDRFQSDRSARASRDDRVSPSRDDRSRFERQDRAERNPLAVVEPEATPLIAQPAPGSAPMLRADDGEVSHAPAFLQVRPAEPREEASGEVRRPRRRSAPRTFEGVEPASPVTAEET
jgi:hypothetical protein